MRRSLPRFLLPILLLCAASSVFAQNAVPCSRGGDLLTPAVVGLLIVKEGKGLGAVTVGGTAGSVERAWGVPSDCRVRQQRSFYTYHLSADGGKTGLVIVVGFHEGRVERILVSLLPHSRGSGPALRTERGVSLAAPMDEVRRVYGSPENAAAREWVYVADGVGFVQSGGRVGAVLIFAPNAPPREPML